MAKQHANLLGIAITETSVQVAECRGTGRSAKAGRRSSFEIDAGEVFESPERFGERLAEHLKQEGYSAKHAAVGLCGRWVLARAMALPSAEGATLAGMVRLKIEREFAGGQVDLCFDYQDAPPAAATGATATSAQRDLLLVGMPKRRLEKLQRGIVAAGLELTRVGATPLDLCASADRDGLGLVVDPAGITLTHRVAGRCAGFATAGYDTTGAGTDNASTKQLVAAASRLAMTNFAGASGPVVLADTAELDADARAAIAAALAEKFGPCDTAAADAAFAAAREASAADTVNLLDSKLAVAPPRTLPGYAKWLIRAAVLFLLVGGVVGYLWVDANRELTTLQDEYDTIEDSAARLQTVREDTRAAAGWFDDRPPVLDCLLELTHTFPKRGRIWVTALTIEPDASGTVSCRADDEDTMWDYVRAMDASPRLSDVVLRRQNDAGRQADELVFDVSFRYRESAEPEEEAL